MKKGEKSMSYTNMCPVCGKHRTEYDEIHDCGEVCESCVEKYAKGFKIGDSHVGGFDFCREYLQSFKEDEQKVGRTSWTDFVLNYCFGIQECNNPALVTELLGYLEKDSILEDKDGTEFVVGQALADYVTEDTHGFAEYLRETQA
jgi:hypothetical protein